MKYYIIAGEASGDLHGSNLIKALKKEDSSALFRVWGGDKMGRASGELVMHYRNHSFMGLFPVLWNLQTIRKNFRMVKKDIIDYKPDALILIDYSGFNLRVAKMLKSESLKIYYYISPQVWAWRKNRVKLIKKVIDRLFSILPFEKEFYNRYDFNVDYVGHPLLDAIEDYRSEDIVEKDVFISKNRLSGKPLIALLPGSRSQEINAQLPCMAEISTKFGEYEFVIAAAPSMNEEIYSPFVAKYPVKLIKDQTYDLLRFSKAAIVTSGTATLETALFKVPQVVCYKAGSLSYFIVKNLVNISFISIVNLIMGEQVIKELIQKDMNKKMLETELNLILHDDSYRDRMTGNYNKLESMLGGPGASARTAKGMYTDLLGL